MDNPNPVCVTCRHVRRSHDEGKCGAHCPGFTAPTTCPLDIKSHNAPRGHTCACVPGQLAML